MTLYVHNVSINIDYTGSGSYRTTSFSVLSKVSTAATDFSTLGTVLSSLYSDYAPILGIAYGRTENDSDVAVFFEVKVYNNRLFLQGITGATKLANVMLNASGSGVYPQPLRITDVVSVFGVNIKEDLWFSETLLSR